MHKQKLLGQFNSTNKDYILQGFENFAQGKNWVDPFAGDGDLLEWANMHKANCTKGYDIDPNKPYDTRDSITNPIDYKGLWVITNPPYLASNKNPDKSLYSKFDDLYKVSIDSIIGCEGGIIIVPANFLSSEDHTIRDIFFSEYKIIACNFFEESVFDDTDAVVIAFYFEKCTKLDAADGRWDIPIIFHPSKKTINFQIDNWTGWRAGAEFYERINGIDTVGIKRYTVDNSFGNYPGNYCINDFKKPSMQSGLHESIKNNIILIRAIDTGSSQGRIKLSDVRDMGIDCLVGLKL